MKRIWRLFCGVLVFISLSIPLAGCFGGGTGTVDSSDSTGSTATDATTAPTTEERPPEETDANGNTFSVEQLKKMKIVYPTDSSNGLIEKLVTLRDQIKKSYGITLTPVPDEVAVDPDGEILIGETNRAESIAYNYDLKYLDYGYAAAGKNIVISGGSEETLYNAISDFGYAIVEMKRGGTKVFYDEKYNYTRAGKYSVDTFDLNGTDIREYKIVYPATSMHEEEILAYSLQYWIRVKTGYELTVVNDGTAAEGRELHVGRTNREATRKFPETNGYNGVISQVGDHTVLFGRTPAEIAEAIDSLVAAVDSTKNGGDKNPCVKVVGDQMVAPDDTLSIMSFNIYGGNPLTVERAARMVDMIMLGHPDVFGIQEGVEFFMSVFDTALTGMYQKSGKGMGCMEHPELCPHPYFTSDTYNVIYFNKNKFELLEEGTKWLSGTPDVPSKYAGANWPRNVNYVVLKRKSDGKVFVYANTHLDENGNFDRGLQANVLANIVSDVSARYDNCPAFITGDFNQQIYENGYKNMISSGYQNSALPAAVKENQQKTVFTPLYYELNPNATNQNFSATIDYCFCKHISEEAVLYYRVMTEKINGNYPSDHYPVYFEFRI